jgi:hypothetical protein
MDAAVERENVELALGILAERGDVQLGIVTQVDDLRVLHQFVGLIDAKPPDAASIEVAVDIDALQLRQRRPAVDVSSGNALAVVRALA